MPSTYSPCTEPRPERATMGILGMVEARNDVEVELRLNDPPARLNVESFRLKLRLNEASGRLMMLHVESRRLKLYPRWLTIESRRLNECDASRSLNDKELVERGGVSPAVGNDGSLGARNDIVFVAHPRAVRHAKTCKSLSVRAEYLYCVRVVFDERLYSIIPVL